MDILLIGSRGREHAMVSTLLADVRIENIYCIPGNGGLCKQVICENIDVTDKEKIAEFLANHPKIELTIVSPDESLSNGLCDYLEERGHRVFGASAKASIMESSKSYCRQLCEKYNIPSPTFKIFNDYHKAKKYVATQKFPLVVKTEGRTAGKGIIFCRNLREAENAMYDVMIAELFGEAGKVVDVESFIPGNSVSVMCLCDGKNILPLKAVDNFKRVFDHDMGMSTAGMGAVYPSHVYTDEVAEIAYRDIFVPTMNALNSEDRKFKGVIGFNLIINETKVTVVDFVVRFFDAESQVMIPLLKTPLLDVFNAVVDEKLADLELEWLDTSAMCVVMASGGYPLEYSKNVKINIGELSSDVKLFHAGTKLVDNDLRTAGGRVMSLFAMGETIEECANKIYANIGKISFEGMHYRKDIGNNI